MKTKHTPGPWTATYGVREEFCLPQYQRKDFSHVILGPNGLPLAELRLGDVNANARLIAAAPEMLEALIALKEQLEAEEADGHCRVAHLIVIDNAIAKATGGAE